MTEHAFILPELEANAPLTRGSENPLVNRVTAALSTAAHEALPPVLGLAGLAVLWWLAGQYLQSSQRLSAFAGFAPAPALTSLWQLLSSGDALRAAGPSLARVLSGLGFALAIGTPIGIALGLVPVLEKALQVPFQILRMISPLSWMPIAILAFPTWDGAIVFLIAAAAVWPIVFATVAGIKRIDPAWIAIGRTLGGRNVPLFARVIAPAIIPDLIMGTRLALGTAWIVLVPAEFLGVTSGLGYAINDARDTLSYDRLAALVLLIGVLGYLLDLVLARALQRSSWTPSA